ncbi:MAG: alanine racemase [Acidobacteria bacterium]|nr:alanine racemase [Acidobacteriota bacterium]MBI3426281.1 alanine racemase [Acidobacteriota bacterium]
MIQPSSSRPTWVEISLANLAHNCRTLKQQLNPPTQLMSIVKADAYGHGALRCAQVLEEAGADWFGVALIEEALELRAAGIAKPIFCLGGFWPAQAGEIITHNLTPALFRLDAAATLNEAARAQGCRVKVHVKVDTGMGRFGLPLAELAAFAEAFKQFTHLELDGLMTHFASADDENSSYTLAQLARYDEALVILKSQGFEPTWRHLANSAGMHGYAQARGTLVRVGALLYGLTGDILKPGATPPAVRPVLSLHSRIAWLKTVPAGTAIGYGATFVTQRESRIATIPIGYADGLRRALSNQGHVLVRGCSAPIVGRVSMDLTMIDVSEVLEVALDDEVVLLGAQGARRITAEEVAALLGTVSYEVVTGISARVPHVYR